MATGLQSISDESWGLDNVTISTTLVSEPSIIILFGAGLVGFALARRRRIK
ncbi:MAG: PEP-CTERM sorting domain-containing protein [Gammaproteobacteria bacterium]|jgi:hypothetical protein|nr:PEP-CTERM sorting domain-containing protein [Gammaproteobacteria bacterium]MBT3722057.1 PEP-CTERM sorting domain-containing protein [Gammaproteobacteria bacterium]MBT4075379.1 PEP-CTERM sorting domain-containing protein [Gammaproteobacteria bacterium]MBT4195950.1 PEP-CTERM sorting domain-containing protein [Gammaproteobacteria bacterium]MBT4451578.1 PEP-CTERM sorting domain-containing protein [Gammaproteobacteria bacterium]